MLLKGPALLADTPCCLGVRKGRPDLGLGRQRADPTGKPVAYVRCEEGSEMMKEEKREQRQ